jgi:hypothetical protein
VRVREIELSTVRHEQRIRTTGDIVGGLIENDYVLVVDPSVLTLRNCRGHHRSCITRYWCD